MGIGQRKFENRLRSGVRVRLLEHGVKPELATAAAHVMVHDGRVHEAAKRLDGASVHEIFDAAVEAFLASNEGKRYLPPTKDRRAKVETRIDPEDILSGR